MNVDFNFKGINCFNSGCYWGNDIPLPYLILRNERSPLVIRLKGRYIFEIMSERSAAW
jgi:hypothetical protein